MSLSSELISQFAKITKDKEEVKKETTVYGTIVNYNGSTYVKLDGSDLLTPISTTTETQSGERVTVMIKNHTATVTGNISSPAARTDDVKEIGNKISEFDIIIAGKVNTEYLEANYATIANLNSSNAKIETLESDNVTIKEKLTANEAVINNLDAKYAKIENLDATNVKVQNLETTKLDASIADIKYATIENLESNYTKTNELDATYATISRLEATEADVKDLDAKYAEIDDLYATKAEIDNLDAKFLTADSATIKNLEADVADIDTLIFGSASGDSIQTSFANAVIAQLGDAQIKSAMIDTVSADKIQSGSIITNNVTVTSSDGRLLISDETIQIKDANRTRVQIGKDATGDYSINIWDADGKLMFSEGGLTESAIKDSIIRDDMVSDTANISAGKLNISSLFKVINDDGSNTLNSSKIAMDDEGQTLDVAFTSMTNDISGLKGTVSSQGTAISVMQGQISSKVWKQDIDEAKGELSTQYSNLEQTVDGINATVASHTTQIQNKADASKVTEVSNKVTELDASLDGFKSSVSNTYATKTELNAIEIGGRNLIIGSSRYTKDSPCLHETTLADGVKFLTSAMYMPVEPGQTYTIQCCTDGIWGNHVTDGTGNGVTHLYLYLMTDETPSGSYSYAVALDLRYKINPDQTTGRGIWTFTVPKNDTKYTKIMFRLDIHSDGETLYKYKYWDFKAEKGNKATDWTPAPEDVDDKINSVDERISNAETLIKQNTDKIELSATKEEITNLSNQFGNYYTIDEVKSAISTEAGKINLSVSNTYATKTELNAIEIGGRNLLRGTGTGEGWTFKDSFDPETREFTRTTDQTAEVFIYCENLFNLEAGQKYTLSFKAKHNGNPLTLDVYILPKTWQTTGIALNIPIRDLSSEYKDYVITFTPNSDATDLTDCQLRFDNNGSATAGTVTTLYIKDVKMEKGTKATDWTPAPEDTDELISETASTLRLEADGISSGVTDVVDRVTVAESSIQQLADAIAMLVTDENGASLMTQTEDGWTFNMGQITNTLDSATTDIEKLTKDLGGVDNTVNSLQQAVTDLGLLTDYVIITSYNGQPCIELGEAENDFKLRITNTQIQFLAKGAIPAWLSNQKLYIEKAEVTNELQFGGFIWKARANGNMGLAWKGVDS